MRYTLDEICISLVRGPFGSALKKEYFVELGENTYKVYEQGNAIRKSVGYGQYYITAEKYAELQRFAVKPLDFIMSCSGTIGELYQIPKDAHIGIINQALLKITLNNEIVDYDFFRYIFKNSISRLEAKGSGIQNVASVKVLKEMKFEIPDITEQRRIVIILNKLSDIINKRKRELSVLDDLMKARFIEMFGHQSNNEKGLPYMKVDDVAEIYLGLTHTPEYVEEGVTFISAKNTSGDYLNLSDVKYISREEFEAAPIGSKPRKNDVLFSRVGSNLGHPVILEEDKELCTFVSLGFLRTKGNVTSNYLKHWMRDEYFTQQVSEHVKGGGQPNLNTGWLKQFKIIVPELNAQEEFDSFCKQVDKTKAVIRAALDEAQLLIDSLMQEYFG